MKVPWTTRRSNQSILTEIGPEYSLEGLMLNLKLQYFGHLMQRADLLEKTLMLGKIEGRVRKGRSEEHTSELQSRIWISYAVFCLKKGKFGKSITEMFLKPYNEKLYACDLTKLDKDAMGRFFPYADIIF